MEALIVSFGLVALAEIGDKTQLLTLVLASRFQRPWPILAGIVTATLLNDLIAALDTGGRRRYLRNGHDLRGLAEVIFRRNAHEPEDSPENKKGQEDVHGRASTGNHYAHPARLGEEFVIGAGAFFDGIIAGHAHVTAERKRAEAVVGVAAFYAEQAGAETEGKYFDFHAGEFCSDEMSPLVHENHDPEHDGDR